jgi:hypothetical protein
LQDSDFTHVFGDGTKSEVPSGIKPPPKQNFSLVNPEMIAMSLRITLSADQGPGINLMFLKIT